MISRAYQYAIYPNPEQSNLFVRTFGCCRLIWNLMLAERIDYYVDNHLNYRNNFSPPPRSPRNMPYEINDINNNMNDGMRNNNMRNNSVSNMNNNYYNNNMNNQYNNGRTITPNVGIIDLNNMDRNIENFITKNEPENKDIIIEYNINV